VITTKYIWDEQNYLAEADGNDTINVVYTNEPQQFGNLISSRISGTSSYHHFDALGSTRQLTGPAGSTTDMCTCDSWGNVLSRTGSTDAHLLWSGEDGYYTDSEVPFHYVRRRTFGAGIARWCSPDPLGTGAGPNPLVYVGNNPIGIRDPSGLSGLYEPIDDRGIFGPPTWVYLPLNTGDRLPAPAPPIDLGAPTPCGKIETWKSSDCPCPCIDTQSGVKIVNKRRYQAMIPELTGIANIPGGAKFTPEFKAQCIPGAPPVSKKIWVCLPLDGMLTYCNARALVLHELTHVAQNFNGVFAVGNNPAERQAYLAQCTELWNQLCCESTKVWLETRCGPIDEILERRDPKAAREKAGQNFINDCINRLIKVSIDPNNVKLFREECAKH
jgi:RHS repeat-associated protein